jgi:hypothetical protein
MFAALTTSDDRDMTGMGSGMAPSLKYPALALAFALVLVHYSVWDLLGQLPSRRYGLGVAPSAGAAPAGNIAPTAACRIAMGVTMAFMLLITTLPGGLDLPGAAGVTVHDASGLCKGTPSS